MMGYQSWGGQTDPMMMNSGMGSLSTIFELVVLVDLVLLGVWLWKQIKKS